MEPILSKQEIADLLRTIQQDGTGPAAPSPTEDDKTHAKHIEISLLELTGDSRQKPDIPNLNLVIDRFRSAFGRSLSHYLQKKVSLEIIDYHSLTFGAYLPEQEHHKATGILSLDPLSSGCLLNYDSHFWSLLLENLLGGFSGAPSGTSDRAATKLEMKLLRASMDLACQAINQAFIPVLQLNTRIIESTADDRLHSFAPSDEVIAVYRFRVAMEQDAGVLELVFPIDSLAPCRSSLEKLSQLQKFENNNWLESIRSGLDDMPVTLIAQSCSIDLSIRQLLNLKVDDVLPVPHDPDSSVEILVEGVARFSGQPGQHRHKKNVKITDTYQ